MGARFTEKDMLKPCYRPGCEARVTPDRLACRGCWYELPVELREEIRRNYRRGEWSRYVDARERAVRYWREGR